MIPSNVDLGRSTLQSFISILILRLEINFLAHLVIRNDFILRIGEMCGGSSKIVAASKVILSL